MGCSANRKSHATPGLASRNLPPNTSLFFPTIFYNNQFRAQPVFPPAGTDLTGKTAIVTGANSGIELECCRQLLSYRLSRVILAVRSQERGEKAATQLRSQQPHADVQVWLLDMGSYPSIQAFVERVENRLDRVDYVVLNAGLMAGPVLNTVPSTGHEEMFQVNYLSQALLTLLLLPVLKSKSPPGSPAHITWNNAALSLIAKFPERKSAPMFPAFDDRGSFDGGDRYNTSKVMAHFFVWKLSEIVPADDVIVSVTDPGYVQGTQLAKEYKDEMVEKWGVLLKKAMALFEKTGRTLENGTSTIVDTLVNHGKESHGCYMMGWKIAP